MPIYTFRCSKCKISEEHIVKMADRDQKIILCGICAERMARQIDAPVIGKPGFQMHAITEGGRKIAGEFGQAAKLEKRPKK